MATRRRTLQSVGAVLAALAAGCTQSPNLTSPEVFVGRFADGVDYQPFKNTSGADVLPDATVCFPETSLYCPDGGATLRVIVPGPGDPANAFAGGAMVAGSPRNLSGYDAVTFWARSTRSAPVVFGLGADQTDSPRYKAEGTVSLSAEWTQYVLPVPLATKLAAERGLFFFSAGADGSPATGFTFWLANIQYVTLGATIRGPNPVLPPACVAKNVGDGAFPAFPSGVSGAMPVAFDVNTSVNAISASNRYFTFTSSDPAVASVDPGGAVSVQGNGTATVIATLGGVEAAGPLTVKVGSANACPALAVPADIAPTPTVPAANVISLFGTAYVARTVYSWQTVWSTCCSDYEQLNVPGTGHPMKKYALHPFAGIGFGPDGSTLNQIDASAMTWFHIDVWTPNGYAFDVKLVNDPTGYPSESTVRSYVQGTGSWVGLEIPMTAFRNLGGTSKLGQMLFLVPDGTAATFYVDNIYFHN
jgi:hypothetical protein